MLLELMIAAYAAAGAAQPAPVDVPRSGRLPHGGRACLIAELCDPRPCMVPVQPRGGPPPLRPGCADKRPLRPAPRVIPARG